MRYLFTTMPAASHLMHLVPLAHALQAAGHDVLVATSGSALTAARTSGLVGYEVGADRDAGAPYEGLVARLTESSAGISMPDDDLMDFYGEVFGEVGARMLPGLVDVAGAWRADAVVYPAIHPAGLVAARKTGAAAVLHGIGTPRPTFEPALRYVLGGEPDEAHAAADAQVDVSPASLDPIVHGGAGPAGAARTVSMRFNPYNSGGIVPGWVLDPPELPRVLVTFGSLGAMGGGGAVYRDVVDATRDLDVELVLTTAGAALPALPDPLPANVRIVDWVPLHALLPTCAAAVHHGGMGSVYLSFVAGVPQVSVPRPGMDCVANAEVVRARGAGLTVDLPAASAATLGAAVRAVLADPGYGRASREVGAEIAAMPTAAEAAAALTGVLAS